MKPHRPVFETTVLLAEYTGRCPQTNPTRLGQPNEPRLSPLQAHGKAGRRSRSCAKSPQEARINTSLNSQRYVKTNG
ncbi:hypothetical protein BBOMB_0502 [Bifidobacterium bombi DSM 19703]|uniref:Uncharacterized protein n=1 Tax=Bifidobacterium bombi DSM 19703 TaxID=1341695 RepID=A0A080N2G2_9BIFI|nr:hypothetical protein BBOMB_0502 [Bifidobacterium bombi DSM 19703]